MSVSHDKPQMGHWGTMINFLKQIVRDTRGATAVEYGLILGLIFLAIVGSVSTFSTSTNAMWTHVSSTISTAIAAA